MLLDLSCAFDTINHELLLRRLEHSVGISGAALEWLHSYVSERYHQVAVSSARSSHCHLERGVAQGSVLGPLLYCIYTRPIGDIVTRHGLQYHCYADDTQIYVTIEKDVSIESALARIETCIIEVAAWMARNDLKLNAEKSQAILFQPLKHGVNKQPEVCVEVAGRRIALSTSVRNLGVVFDSRLSMEEQVAQTAKSCYYQLRNIGQIRSSITEGACRTLVHALVTSRLRKRTIVWNSAGYPTTSTADTKLCRSPDNTDAEVRTHHASVAPSSLVTDSSMDSIQSTCVDLLCSECHCT